MVKLFRDDSAGTRRTFSNGVRFPRILHSWEKVGKVIGAFTSKLSLQGDKEHQYRLVSQLVPRLLSCPPMREKMQVCTQDTTIVLDALCGIDALPLLHSPTVLPSHITHFSISFLQYGPLCRSPFLRHLMCIYAGKDNPENMKMYLHALMDDLFSFREGRVVDVPVTHCNVEAIWRPVVHINPHLLADLVALFAQRGIMSFTSSVRCLRCPAGPAYCRHPGDVVVEMLALISRSEYLFAWDPLNLHTDFPLHFRTNWCVRILRVTEGYCVYLGGTVQEFFYAQFKKPGLASVGISADQVKDLRVIGRHVKLLCEVFTQVVSHPDMPNDARSSLLRQAIQGFCKLDGLLCQFKLKDSEVKEAIDAAAQLACSFRQLWIAPDNLFPYFHSCDCELERELLHVHNTHGVGVGAFSCQSVEALGHHLKLATKHSGWCPDTFLKKLFEAVEIDFISHEGLFEAWREHEDFFDPPVGECIDPAPSPVPTPVSVARPPKGKYPVLYVQRRSTRLKRTRVT